MSDHGREVADERRDAAECYEIDLNARHEAEEALRLAKEDEAASMERLDKADAAWRTYWVMKGN